MMNDTRRFECKTGGSNKFWCITTLGNIQLETKWGKIGTPGTSKVKLFKSTYQRHNAYLSIIQQKLSKGYIEVDVLTENLKCGNASSKPKKTPKIVNKPYFFPQIISERRFEYPEINRFWYIAKLEPCGFITRWGKIGTSGASKIRNFTHLWKRNSAYSSLVYKKKITKPYLEKEFVFCDFSMTNNKITIKATISEIFETSSEAKKAEQKELKLNPILVINGKEELPGVSEILDKQEQEKKEKEKNIFRNDIDMRLEGLFD